MPAPDREDLLAKRPMRGERTRFPVQRIKFAVGNTDLIGAYRNTSLFCICLCDASEGDITITLPSAKLALDTVFIVKKTDTSSNKVYIQSVEPDEEINAYTSITYKHYMDTRGSARTVISDGADYHLIGHIP